MLNYLTMIFACQLVGETATRTFSIPVPGPVFGMVLLFAFLIWRGHIPDDLQTVTNGLLGNLSLLFVPAGVGVMLHFSLLGTDGLAIGASLIGSTILTVAATALCMVGIKKMQTKATNTGGSAK